MGRVRFTAKSRHKRASNKDFVMHKRDLDHLLEAAVAKAIGVKLPAHRRSHRSSRKAPAQREPIQHAA